MKKALIIDDEQRTRELIAKMITSFDLGIEAIPMGESVQSGIAAIQAIQPDLVFLDIQMPDGTGFDLLGKIQNQKLEPIVRSLTFFQA